MRSEDIIPAWAMGCCAVLLFVFMPLAMLASAYFESQAYNRLTGANTTTWDAVFLELRVQEQPKP